MKQTSIRLDRTDSCRIEVLCTHYPSYRILATTVDPDIYLYVNVVDILLYNKAIWLDLP